MSKETGAFLKTTFLFVKKKNPLNYTPVQKAGVMRHKRVCQLSIFNNRRRKKEEEEDANNIPASHMFSAIYIYKSPLLVSSLRFVRQRRN